MPTLDELNEIKSNLLVIGNEPGILAAKGEVPVDIGPPETGLSDDINALLDDFGDEEEGTDSGTSEAAAGAEDISLDDFNFDLEDEDPGFDMDGFDAPEDIGTGEGKTENEEPESGSVEEELPDEVIGEQESVSDPDDLSFDDEDSDGVDSDDLSSDNQDNNGLIPDLVEEEPIEEASADDLGFAEELGLSLEDELNIGEEDSESLTDDSSVNDEDGEDPLVPDPVEGEDEPDLSLDDAIDFEEEDSESLTDDSSVNDEDSEDPVVTDPVEGEDEPDLSLDDDFDFGEEDFGSISDDPVTEPVDEKSIEGDEGLDFDLSGGDSDFDDIDNSDDFGLPDDEVALGDDEVSLDDSDAGDPGEFELNDESFDDDLEIDEFDLGDLGQDFGVLEEDLAAVPDDSVPESAVGGVDSDPDEEEFELHEDVFEKVKVSLLNLPRNLKLIIEEEIGEKGLKGAPLKRLIDALSEGKTPKEIAAITSKIIGKKIKIPANYTKKTGLDFEEEKGSFQYTLIHNILPLLKIFAISIIIIAALSFVSYEFIYKPIHAYILYNRGYEQLENGNYNLSSDLFDQAFEKKKVKKQFYRYSEGYIDENQWSFARNQYEKLLDHYPFDKKGTIDYATMEFEKLADYEHSTALLNEFLIHSDKYKRDYDALLLLGDIYLEWGWEDNNRYDDARLAYAKVMSTYGVGNKVLFRMLRFFIRTDNAKEVYILKERFQADMGIEIDPEAYAELAGYQIDRKDISDVQELLFRAKEVEEDLPEIHYQLARLFNMTGEGDEEDKALERTLINLKNKKSLNRRNLEVNIDTLRRKGERFYFKEEYLQAQEVYQKGIDLLEKSRERNIFKGSGRDYGRLYADLGHIYYYISENPDIALSQYGKAEEEGFYSPEIYYNKGYIRYRTENFKQALFEFYNSAGSFSTNSNLLYATANTLFQRNDYFAAQGYYNHLLDILEQKISREFTIRLEEREDHRTLVENLMKTYNNIGVTLYGLFERTGDPEKFTDAIVSFTRSTGYFDDLTRSQDTMERTEAINLASLNQRKMLYPIPDYELQIFVDLPKHLAP